MSNKNKILRTAAIGTIIIMTPMVIATLLYTINSIDATQDQSGSGECNNERRVPSSQSKSNFEDMERLFDNINREDNCGGGSRGICGVNMSCTVDPGPGGVCGVNVSCPEKVDRDAQQAAQDALLRQQMTK